MYPRILFFINGVAPSLDEQLAADQLAPCRVSFRNANFVPETGALEACDGVFGDATPKRYKEAYKPAEDAIKAFVEKREAEHKGKAQAAEQAKQKVADRVADEADAKAKKADEEAEKADKAKKAAAKLAKDKADAAKAQKAKAEEAAKAEPADAAPTVEAAQKAQAAWTGNGDAT
jgi:hypothetical protein